MKNLNLSNVYNYYLGINRKVFQFCVDSKQGQLYFYEDGVVFRLSMDSREETARVHLKEYYECKEKIPELVGMNYLESSEAVCILFSNGDLLVYTVTSDDLMCAATGVKTIAWSPDEEVLAIISNEDNLLIMTNSFDFINETPLHQTSEGENQFITVGWGKKETQFHGSAGKGAAKTQSKPCHPIFDWDDLCPKVSWRGDGELFVVSSVDPHSKSRRLRIFNREGILQCSSEDVDGLEAPVSWKPSGALIASVQRLPNKYMVIFFEKNGLRHGEFNLPFKPDEMLVKDLIWNADSTVLAVCCESLKDSSLGCLQLWTANNYHWYLKRSINYTHFGKFTMIFWDPLQTYRLHLLSERSTYSYHDYCWAIHHSNGKTEDDSSCVAVIDGNKLLMTQFRSAIVPPPMCSYSIHLPLPVSDVIFPTFCDSPAKNVKGYSNDFIAVLEDNSLIFFSQVDDLISEHKMADDIIINVKRVGLNGFKSTSKYHKPMRIFTLDYQKITEMPSIGDKQPQLFHHWHWISEDTIICSMSIGGKTCLLTLRLPPVLLDATSENSVLRFEDPLIVEGLVVSLAVYFRYDPEDTVMSNGKPTAIIQSQTGNILKLEMPDYLSVFTDSKGNQVETLPPLVKMEVCTISGQEFIFGLTNKNRFYINSQDVLSDCNSFFVHSEYLLLTTNRHTLICVLLEKMSIELFLEKKLEGCMVESIRRVERGSRLVLALPKHYKVILQMPRGNLECIEPRALSLLIIANMLERKEYIKAFDMVRVQRINMNVLCDLSPNEFMKDLKDFVVEVKNPNWLSLFLCELQEENVCETMYSPVYYLKTIRKAEKLENKVETICDGLREAMEIVDEERYLLPILASYVVKKTKEDIVSALKRVQSIKVLAGNSKGEMSRDEALKYLIYLVDVDTLYDVALGIYDFDLVLMIAARSSKDPKEYIPFINDLKKLEVNYQHYKIDMHLKSYSSALKSISKCGEEHCDELMNLISSQKLYSEALKLFPKNGELYKKICDAYADHLLKMRLYEEAGVMQKLSHNFEEAIVSFKKAGNWRQTLTLAQELNYSQSQMDLLCREVCRDLKERRNYSDAAFIYNEYLNDHEECVDVLASGCLWEEAIRVSVKCKRLDLIDTHIKPGIKEHYETLIGRLSANSELFLKYKNRLSVVREEKLKAQKVREEKGDFSNLPDDDLVSEASSVIGSAVGSSFHSSSKGSSYSRASAKNRRKHERKLLSLKQGNPNEEAALITALKAVYVKTFAQEMKDEVRGLCIILIQFGNDELAEHLQTSLSSVQTDMLVAKSSIWPIKQSTENLKYGPQATSSIITELVTASHALQLQSNDVTHTPPEIKADHAWKLNIFSG